MVGNGASARAQQCNCGRLNSGQADRRRSGSSSLGYAPPPGEVGMAQRMNPSPAGWGDAVGFPARLVEHLTARRSEHVRIRGSTIPCVCARRLAGDQRGMPCAGGRRSGVGRRLEMATLRALDRAGNGRGGVGLGGAAWHREEPVAGAAASARAAERHERVLGLL